MVAINEELQQTEQSLHQLNEELEERVETRTRELAASEARFRSMVEQATVAMLVFQGDSFVISTANAPMLSLLGKSKQVMGMPLLKAMPELNGQPIVDILYKVYRTGESVSGNEIAVQLQRNGVLETGYFDFTYTPLTENGKVTGVLEVAVEVTQQVVARRKVEASEHRLRNMIATTPYGMAILRSRDLIIERANLPILAIWNRRKDQILEHKLMDVFPELEGQPFPELLKRVFDTGERVDVPEMILDIALPEGGTKQYYVKFSYDPLFDLNGNVESILVSVSDISELVHNRKLLQERQEELESMNEEILAGNEELADTNEELTATNEELTETQQILALINEQLEKSENLFRGLFEQAPLGMAVLRGPEHVIDQANDNMLHIWGRTRHEVIGKPHRVARPELQGQSVFDWLDEAYASGEQRINREFKVHLYVGPRKTREAYVNSIYQPLLDSNGKVTGILIIIDEVTDRVIERKQTEQAQEQLKLAIESAELGTWYIDTGKGELMASARTKELFGFYTDEPMSLQDALDQIAEDHREDVINAIEASIANNESYDMEYPIVGYHDRVVRWVRATGKLYASEAGRAALFSGTLLDITDRKEREQRKDDFISVASHELKTPLTTLNASMQLLTRLYRVNPAAPKIPELIQKANFNLTRLMHLIEDLMNVSRLQQGKLPLHKSRFKLADLINECCEHVKTNGTHNLLLNGDTDLEVFADQQRISQVVVNFVNNAVKYAPDSKEIVLQIVHEGGYAKVSVQDFGPGIPADKQPHLFDRYYRVHESGIQFSGLGLGLYISAEIIERHNGQIGVDSKLNEGSTFWFTLPLGDGNA
nr:PAS domain S-box protein [Mucilaginibacter sp. Bleaf8]